MKAKPYTLLIHPFFLFNLVLLLLNDFYLKYAFHNDLTGKLSDFTGLFIFAVFLFVLFPAYKQSVLVFCTLFFCWWKSPFSGPFIFFVNDRLSLPVHRVVDYTDISGLLVLPLAYWLKPPVYPVSFWRSVAVYVAGTVSFFSFCATTMIPRQLVYRTYRENEIYFNESFNSRLSESAILEKLDPQKLGYKKDSARFYQVTESGGFYQRVKKFNDSTAIWIPVSRTGDTALFVKKIELDFYTLPEYVLNGDTLYNLEFSIIQKDSHRKPTRIRLISFQSKSLYEYGYFEGKMRRRYKKHFKDFLNK